jgi:hypothetical protein
MAFQGEEAMAIREFCGEHRGHRRDCYIDNGFQNEPDWAIDYESDGAMSRETEGSI